MWRVVVLGGGFAGVAAIHTLLEKHRGNIEIVLIDRNNFHLFTPSLYEAATSEIAKKNIIIPFHEMFGQRVKFIKGEVEKISEEENKVILSDKREVDFDFLLIALGSRPCYFRIEGLAENSLTLKTAADALRIKNKIKEFFENKVKHDQRLEIVIGGGGFSGCELAAELCSYRDRLTGSNEAHKRLFDICIIQGSSRLLRELDKQASAKAQERLEQRGVKVFLGEHIKKVGKEYLETESGERHNFDLLIWTGGVEACAVEFSKETLKNQRGQIVVNEFLQSPQHPNIFAAGDIAFFTDIRTGKHAPAVAQVAEDQGKTAALNILSIIDGKHVAPYRHVHFGYIVPLGGKWSIARLKWLRVEGFLAWVIQQLVVLRYFFSILPLTRAFKRWDNLEQDLTI